MNARAIAALWLLSASALAGARPRYGGEAQLLVRGPIAPSLDPMAAVTPAERAAARLMFETLVSEDATGALVPALLIDLPRASDDGRKVQLLLRAGLAFQDGSPLTAEHVAAAFERLARQPPSAPYAALGLAVLSARAVHPALVEVELRFPYPDFTRLLLAPALAPARSRGTAAEPRWMGAGPFSLAAARAGGARLTAWKECPTGRPFLDAVQIAAEPDPRRAIAAVERGDASAAAVGTSGRITYLAVGKTGAEADRLRAGALAAIDPAELVKAFVRTPAEPAPPPPAMPPGITPPAGLPLQLYFDAAEPDHKSVAERIQVRLRSRGADVRLVGTTLPDLSARLASGSYSLAVFALPRLPEPGAEIAALELLFAGPNSARAMLAEIGAAPDRASVAARARAGVEQRAWLQPLYVETARLQAGKRLAALTVDSAGAPRLGEAWLSEIR